MAQFHSIHQEILQEENENIFDQPYLVNIHHEITTQQLKKELKKLLKQIKSFGYPFILLDSFDLEESNQRGKATIQCGRYNSQNIVIKWIHFTSHSMEIIMTEIKNLLTFQSYDYVVQFVGITLANCTPLEEETSEVEAEDFFIGLVMERAPFGSLDQYLQQHPTTPFDRRLIWSIQLCQMIQGFHQKEFVHRDIKPQNILLFENDKIKLCDLEISKKIDNEFQSITYIGTPSFSAPESHTKINIDERKIKGYYTFDSEIYSIGITLTAIFTNKYPMIHESKSNYLQNSLLFAIQHGILPLSSSEDIKDLLLSCIDDIPSKRCPIWVLKKSLAQLKHKLSNKMIQSFNDNLKFYIPEPDQMPFHHLMKNMDENFEYQKVLQGFSQSPIPGESFAHHILGFIYHKGQFKVSPNIMMAIECYHKAIDYDNHPIANYLLGNIYFEGQLEGQLDYQKAEQYFHQAAHQGDGDSQHQLGYIYYMGGYGIEKNIPLAVQWYEQAIQTNENNQLSAHNLGNIYYSGEINGNPNYEKALEYYFIAAKTGLSMSQYQIGYIYHQGGYGIDSNISLAIQWYEQAIATDNHQLANLNLGNIYAKGLLDQQPDYLKAEPYFLIAANNGNDFAQYNLGVLYHEGKYGIDRNISLAIEWYEKAINTNNNKYANYNLGNIYFEGILLDEVLFDGKPNYLKAKEYFQQSAEQDISIAQVKLALIYQTGGYHVEKDISLAMQWYQKAIDNDQNPYAYINYGNIHSLGLLNGEPNFLLASEFYQHPADQGISDAQFKLGFVYFLGGHGINQNISLALQWFQKAIDNDNNKLANEILGNIYYLGILNDIPDYAQAIVYNQQAAIQGNETSQYQLGMIYSQGGYGVNKDIYQAVYWFQQATDNTNHQPSNYQLGNIYLTGEINGTPDYAKAIEYYQQSANQGDSMSQFQLGFLYHNGGNGLNKNIPLAIHWYQQSIDNNQNPYACYNLGCLYFYGLLNDQIDYVQAAKYFQIAVEQGYSEALLPLGEIYYKGGYGIESDLNQAMECFLMKCDQNEEEAKRLLEETLNS